MGQQMVNQYTVTISHGNYKQTNQFYSFTTFINDTAEGLYGWLIWLKETPLLS